MTAPRVAFLVVRTGLAVGRWGGRPSVWDDTHYQGLEDADNGPVRVPEAVCSDRAAAEREREQRERSAREVMNPFWLGPLDELSSRDEDGVRADLRALGPTPPQPAAPVYNSDNWAAWWDRESANWTDELRAAIWAMLDKVRLFEVVEIELE